MRIDLLNVIILLLPKHLLLLSLRLHLPHLLHHLQMAL